MPQNLPYNVTPAEALQFLKDGNQRFVNNSRRNRDLRQELSDTASSQHPFAALVSCMDSRTATELIFDQGIGHLFSLRVAGNVINDDILGSLEYATAAVGTPLIVVLGHTGCGAIGGACNGTKLEHLTGLLEKITPAIEKETRIKEKRDGSNPQFVDEVSRLNALEGVQIIINSSETIKKLAAEKKIGVVPALYDMSTGVVTFFENEAIMPDAENKERAKVA